MQVCGAAPPAPHPTRTLAKLRTPWCAGFNRAPRPFVLKHPPHGAPHLSTDPKVRGRASAGPRVTVARPTAVQATLRHH
eukprot:2062006-Alexandrium_andersonii.AAC.1